MEYLKLNEFRLTGLLLNKKTTNNNGQSGIDCGGLWQKFEQENIALHIPGKLSDDIFAVYFDYEGDHTKPFSYFIGCKSRHDAEVPSGMNSLTIPASDYIKLVAKGEMPDCVAGTWNRIWNSEIKRSYKFDFEVYDKGNIDWGNAVVDIFVSFQGVQ